MADLRSIIDFEIEYQKTPKMPVKTAAAR